MLNGVRQCFIIINMFKHLEYFAASRLLKQPTAEDVVNYMEEKSLVKILKRYGEEKRARVVARTIVDSRYAFGRITTTTQLADIVATAFPV